MSLKWHRANDGFVNSKCGRYTISPLYCGSTRPQAFEVWYKPPHAYSERVSSMDATQREAKEAAQRHWDRVQKGEIIR